MPGRLRHALLMLAACGIACGLAGAARALEPDELDGWWISPDLAPDALPVGRGAGQIELVVISGGTVDDRYMLLASPLVTGECLAAVLPACSDAPLVRRARLLVGEGTIGFETLEEGPGSRDPAGANGRILRAATVTAVPEWTAALDAGGDRLTLEAAAGRRVLIRIDPVRLARLRAGAAFLPGGPAGWPCYLATASAGEAAFAGLQATGLQATGREPPAGFDGFLHTASYLWSSLEMQMVPTPDERDAAARRPADFAIEIVVSEPFDDIRRPATQFEKRALFAKGVYVGAVAAGHPPEEARREAMVDNVGRPVRVAIDDDAIAAFAAMRAYRFDRKAAVAVGLACPEPEATPANP